MRNSLWFVASLIVMISGVANAVSLQVADYQFASNLHSSIAGAPDLATVGSGTAFASEPVLYGQSQTVLTFTAGSGLSLGSISTILADTASYTIALQARITPSAGYSKFIDLSNGVDDFGLYSNGGKLEFYSYAGGNDNVVKAKYGDIVLTRDSSGSIKGYYNGSLQFTIDDSSNHWAVVDASNILRFFLDDHVGAGTENSDGAVARIRLWNYPLDPLAVLELTDPIFADGFEPSA